MPSLCQLHSLSPSSNAIGSTFKPTPSPSSFYLASSTDTGSESVVPSTSLHLFSYHSSPSLNVCSQMSTSLPSSGLTFMPPSHLSSPLLSMPLAAQLIKALHNHSHLKSLKLDNTGIGLPECVALAQWLSSPTCSLERLNIGKNNLTFEATEVIVTTLCQNCSLHYFYITASQIATNLLTPMISLPLIDLNLNYCHIGPEGACEIATALCDHTVIQYLYLSCNPIEDKGARALADMLLHNKSLKRLFLPNTSLTAQGTQALLRSLQHNTTLCELWLSKPESLTAYKIVNSASRVM